MAFDGSVKFDTKLDETGLKKGLDGAASVAKKAAGAITAAIGTGIGAAVKFGSDFEAAMSSVYAISRASAEDAAKLKDAALEAGRVTQFSASQSANALEYLSLAGYDATESIEALPKVLNLAAAGGMDLAYASDLLTDSMAVMGLGIEDMDNFSDQLAMAASKSNTSVAQLGEAVLVAGGQAKLCGMTVDQMNTALGILADKGIKGSEGGTALRNTLKNLYTPTSAASKELSRLGVATAYVDGRLRPMQDVLKDLNGALAEMNADDKTKSMDKIFDTRTIAAATALLDDCGKRWDELNGYLNKCNGAAAQMAETMNDNLQGKLKLVASAAESVAIAFYDSISEPLKVAAEEGASQLSILAEEMRTGEMKAGIEALGTGLGALITNVIELARVALPPLLTSIGWLCENIGVIGPLVLGAVGAIKAYTVATTAAQAITALMNATLTLLNPYGLAVAGVVGLTAGIVALKNKMSEATEEIDYQAEAAQDLKDAHDALEESLENEIDKIESNASHAENLADELDKLLKTEHKSAEEKERMASIVEELNELLPGLKLNYNKEKDELYDLNGALVTNTDAIRNNIEAQKKQAQNDVYLDSYKERIKHVQELKDEYEKLTKQIQAGNPGKTEEEIAQIVARWEELSVAIAEAEEDAENFYNVHLGDGTEITTTVEIDGSNVKTLDDFKKIVDELDQDFGNTAKIYELYAKFVFNGGDIEGANSIMQDLGYNVDEGFALGIKNGEESVLLELAGLMGTSIDEVRKILGIQSPSTVFKGIGVNVILGLIAGLQTNNELVNAAIARVASNLITKAKQALQIQSPSKKFKDEIGAMIPAGIAVGIKENEKKATEAYDNMMDLLERQLDAGIITEKEYFLKQEQMRDKYLTKGTKEWLDATQDLYEGWLEIEENARDEELEVLEHSYAMGEISTKEYYEALEKYRDKYFKEGTEEWRDYTEDIYDHQREVAEDAAEVMEDTADKIKDAYEDAFEDVNDSIEDMADGLKNVGDFYVTGTVEINGKDVEYSSLIDMDKRSKWYEDLYNRVAGVKERLKNSGFADEEIDSFWEHFRGMGEEGMYDYGNLLLNSSDADFVKQVKGYLEGEAWGQKTADLIYADDKLDAEKAYADNIMDILVEAGKELPEEFYTLGDKSGEEFSEGFLKSWDKAMSEATADVQTLGSYFLPAEGETTTWTMIYNIYSTAQTVSGALMDAGRHALMEKGRYA